MLLKASVSAPSHVMYNIGNNQPVKLLEFVHMLVRCMSRSLGRTVVFDKHFERMKPGDVPATYASMVRLKELVGFRPRTSLEVSLQLFFRLECGLSREELRLGGSRLIDIHCHLLPGLDDGPERLEDSLEMARLAVADGIHTIVATPHHLDGTYENEREVVEDSVLRFKRRLEESGIPLKVLQGQELHCAANLIDLLHDGHEWMSLNRSRYVLLEFPPSDMPRHALDVVHEMRVLGIVPIIAHPERNRGIAADPDQLSQLIEAGALGQVTSQSLTGRFGSRVQKIAADLCRKQLIHFVASDAHNVTSRPFLLREAYDWIEEQLGERYAAYYAQNAEKIIADEELDLWSPLKKRRLFSWLARS